MIGLCTDSSAHLPPEIVARFGIEVVPLTITIDDIDHLEGVDLDNSDFYSRFERGEHPDVVTSEPSSGQFAAAYEDLIERGCTSILSVHITPALSGALNPARLAARVVDIPVRVIDSGTGGFAMGCCVWAAGEAIASGGSLDDAAAAADRVANSVGNAALLRAADQAEPFTVVTFHRGGANVLRRFVHAVDAINEITARAVAWGDRLRVGVGHTDSTSLLFANAVEDGVGEAANVIEVVRYRIGPSMGALTGPGAVGCVMFPAG